MEKVNNFKKTFAKSLTNLMNWEDKLPIPDNVIQHTDDWAKHDFYIVHSNLGTRGGEYFVFGGKLYENNDGVNLLDYTGEITFGDYLACDEGDDFELMFKATFLKGEVKEIILAKNERRDSEERKKLARRYMDIAEKEIARRKSFFFKYLYRPWRAIVLGVSFIIMMILGLIGMLVRGLARILTPW